MNELDKLRGRARRGDSDRALPILDRAPLRRPDPRDELYDLPISEIYLEDGRPDPWWVIPLALAMWALVAVEVVILMTAFVA